MEDLVRRIHHGMLPDLYKKDLHPVSHTSMSCRSACSRRWRSHPMPFSRLNRLINTGSLSQVAQELVMVRPAPSLPIPGCLSSVDPRQHWRHQRCLSSEHQRQHGRPQGSRPRWFRLTYSAIFHLRELACRLWMLQNSQDENYKIVSYDIERKKVLRTSINSSLKKCSNSWLKVTRDTWIKRKIQGKIKSIDLTLLFRRTELITTWFFWVFGFTSNKSKD